MKIAVYNRHWDTGGGGEKYAGFIAECLSREHQVHLLGHSEIDLGSLEEKLELDLSRVQPCVVGCNGAANLKEASRDYDLLLNASFKSSSPSGARHGIYFVYFPVPYDPKRVGMRSFWKNRKIKSDWPWASLQWGQGWLPMERGRYGNFRWSNGCAELLFYAPEGVPFTAVLKFGCFRPREAKPARVKIEVDGGTLSELELASGPGTQEITVPLKGVGAEYPVRLFIHSDTFSLARSGSNMDDRQLGVPLLTVKTKDGGNNGSPRAISNTASSNPALDFLDSYHRLVSISEYTRSWIARLWGKESEVLYPPVSPQPAGSKAPTILSVGRFFDSADGHSKKQLEMVGVFRRLCDGGLRGWEYHLVGGCHPRNLPYLNQIRAAAEGLPVQIHLDVSRAHLSRLYSNASFFWHGTGLGEREAEFPDRLEHFGISIVEAMSAGAIPFVVAKGGQREIVQDGVSGRYFSRSDELAALTRELMRSPAAFAKLSIGAIERSKAFGPSVFAEKLSDLVAEILDCPD